MTINAQALLVGLALSASPVRAEIPPPTDELSRGYAIALVDLCSGKERRSIVDRLMPLVEKHSASTYAQIARPFLLDLTASAIRPPTGLDQPPEMRLADTIIPFYLLKYAENWGDPLKVFMAKMESDPVSELAAGDRVVISRLILLLGDRSPARCEASFMLDWDTPQPRVCDLALALIEYHGKVRFHSDTIFGTYLHQLPEADREKVTKRVALWWQEVKDKSVIAGVRAQLTHGSSYPETVWMAKSLARLAEGQNTDDRTFALNVLREMVKENPRNHVAAYAADALAELGDTSAVDVFYAEWKSWLGRPGLIHDSGIAFYLCRHGRRREWELLYEISIAEVNDGKGPGDGAIWACVVNSGVANTKPFAIPILGLSLSQIVNTGSRSIQNATQSFSYADTACELLQRQVGMDFGYRPNGSAEERLVAIKKAQSWWDQDGKSKFSYDFIELKIVPADR